jgi:hypothetical protein
LDVAPPRSRRTLALGFVALSLTSVTTRPALSQDIPLVLPADRDDDDLDGQPDGDQQRLGGAALLNARPLDPRLEGATLAPTDRAADEVVRVVAEGASWPWGRPLPRQAYIQGRRPGRATLLVRPKEGPDERLSIVVVGVGFRGGDGLDLDPAQIRASLQRTPPEAAPGASAAYGDPDALRIVVRVPRGGPIPPLAVESVAASDLRLDVLTRPTLEEVKCNPGPADVRCLVSEPLRFVVDDIDRSHPVSAKRSLRAEVGGAIVVRSGERVLQSIRVEGPRRSIVGPIPRLRAQVRALVVRLAPGGAPAIGGTDAGAIALLRSELALASATWGQCGITFGPAQSIDIRVVDPPPPFLVAFGNDLGLPASGGDVTLKVDGRPIILKSTPRQTPESVAHDFAAALTRAGYKPTLSPNARIGPGATGSIDVLVRRRNGSLAVVEAGAITDPTLVVRVGRVDLSDGLQHFGDMDSMAGTLEERTLLKAFDDGDPTTLEIFVVPAFASGGRIGESFIASDLSSLRNVVILDRAGLRARRSSLTLAHELGHVLLNMPGHPDDFGVDTPTLLMDSDAADASAFGPRRLSLDDCVRAVREAGPKARTPLLKAWPLEPLSRL